MNLPPLPGMPAAHRLPPLPILKRHNPNNFIKGVTIDHVGKDKLVLKIDATLTRADAFRLIGELERMAGFL